MQKSMTFNHIRKPWLYLLEGRQKSPFAPVRNNLIRVTGMPGAYVGSKETDVLYITQPIGFVVKDDEHALRLKDELAEWLVTSEAVPLQFDDEPGRTYYAEVEGTIEDFSRFVDQRRGVITFLVADGHSYGTERTPTISDTATIENKGTAEADPIFELTATQKTTFAMVSNGVDEYNLIGQPADDDVQVVDEKTKIYEINGMSGWSSNGTVSDSRFPTISGTMQYDEVGYRVGSYGTGTGIHGPAVIRELDENLQDFEVDAIFDIISEREIEAWRMEIRLYDENMNDLGMIGVKDNNAYEKLRVGLGRVGEYRGTGIKNGYLIGESNYRHNFGNNASIQMRFTRKGNKFTILAGRRYVNRLYNVESESYFDVENEFQGKLKYVQIMIGTYGSRVQPSRLRINKLDVYKLNKVEVDQTPYILFPDDIVIFDHKNDDILVNGEPRNDLKNFGGSFFKLQKGENVITVTPEDSFTGNIKYRERYR